MSSLSSSGHIIPERVRIYLGKGLAGTPVVMARLLEGVSDAEANRRVDPERFTIREALAHVADWEGIWLDRLRKTAAEDDPFLPGYDEAQWAIDNHYADADIAQQMAKFIAGRAELIAFLSNLPPEAFSRTARHGEIGPLTLGDLATLVLAHDAYHLRQFTDFRQPVPA